MNEEKFSNFLSELDKLQHKYGIRIGTKYEHEIDYDYEENPYLSGTVTSLVLIDQEGNEYEF